jgi:hypothetical protein
MNDVMNRTFREPVTYIISKALFQHLCGMTKERGENFHSGWMVFMLSS